MAFEITKLDFSQIENFYCMSEPILMPVGNQIRTTYVPMDNSATVFLNKTLLYKDIEYTIVDDVISINIPYTTNDTVYVQYITTNEVNLIFIFSDELGNPVFTDINNTEYLYFN